MFLTREQLKILTGTSDRKKQADCLRANRIPFTLDVFLRPVVTVSAVEGKTTDADPPAEDRGFLPSWLRAA